METPVRKDRPEFACAHQFARSGHSLDYRKRGTNQSAQMNHTKNMREFRGSAPVRTQRGIHWIAESAETIRRRRPTTAKACLLS
jgi:hypothetical protein